MGEWGLVGMAPQTEGDGTSSPAEHCPPCPGGWDVRLSPGRWDDVRAELGRWDDVRAEPRALAGGMMSS